MIQLRGHIMASPSCRHLNWCILCFYHVSSVTYILCWRHYHYDKIHQKRFHFIFHCSSAVVVVALVIVCEKDLIKALSYCQGIFIEIAIDRMKVR